MEEIGMWDGVILAVAGYVAVLTLVRLMSTHRKKVSDELQQQIRAEQTRRKQQEKQAAKLEREEQRKRGSAA